MKWSKLIQFAASSSFGGTRFLFVFLLTFYATNKELASYISNFFIVQLIANFTSVGLAGLVLTRVANECASESKRKYSEFLFYSLILSFFCAPLIYFLHCFYFLSDFLNCFLMLISLSLYTILRHYFQARQLFFRIVSLDLAGFFVSIGLYFYFGFSMLWSTTFGLMLVFLIYSCTLISRFTTSLQRSDVDIVFHNSISNVMTSWPFMVMPSILLKYGSVDLSAYIGVLLSYLNIAQILVRGMTFNAIVYFSSLKIKSDMSKYLADLRRNVLFFSFSISIFVVVLANIMFPPVRIEFFLFCFFIFISVLASQYSAASSSCIMALEKSKSIFKTNLLFSLMVFVSIVVTYLFGDPVFFVAFLMFAMLIKSIATDKVASRLLHERD